MPLRRPQVRPPFVPATLAIVAAAALSACGGGGSSDPVTPPVVPASLTLTGTAATGAAIAGKTVEAKCDGGSSSATSNADGSYTVTVSAGKLPCVLRVTAADGTVLHSLATGSGSAATANLTPVSELVLAQLSGGTPATFYGSFDSTAAATLTPARAQAAVAAVVDTLKAAGVDLSAAGDVLTATLVAANGSTAGNAFDKALDALKAQLTATGTTLATLTTTVAATSPAAPVAALSNTPSLPADMLLKPAASNCSALRSGKYRLVYSQNRNGSDGSYDTQVVTIDAAKLTVTNAAAEVSQLTANGNCRYKTPPGGDVVVSQAGVIVAQINDNGAFHLGVLFPEQAHTLAELAGEWNTVQLNRTVDNGPIHVTTSTLTLDATGTLTAGTACDDGVNCQSGTLASTPNFPPISSKVNASGGFDYTNSRDGWTDRVFLYKSGGGELMRVQLAGAGGHLALSTRKVAASLPAVGRVSEFWNMTQATDYTSPAATDGKNTVTSVDATAKSYLRDQVINTSTGVTRPETILVENPRSGYVRRLAGTATASNGSTGSYVEFIALPLRGTGISAVGLPSLNQLQLSVSK